MNTTSEMIRLYARQLKIPTFAEYEEILRQADPSADFGTLLLELADIHKQSRIRKYPPPLAKAVTLVELSMGANLNVNSLARKTGVSRYTLIRLFRGWLGRTPQEYISAQRMEYAKQLVSSGRLSHKEIARELGFKNASHFSLAFKKYTGVPPRTYKANLPL